MSLSAETTQATGFLKAVKLLFERKVIATNVERIDLEEEEADEPGPVRSYVRELIKESGDDLPMTRTVAAFYLGVPLALLEKWAKDPGVESPFKYGGKATKAEVEAFAQQALALKHSEELGREAKPIGGYWDHSGRFYCIDENGAILADAEFNGVRKKDLADYFQALGKGDSEMRVMTLGEAMEKPWTHASEKEPWLSRWAELLEHDIADAQAKLERAKSDLANTREKLLDERLPPARGEDKPHTPF